MLEDLAVEENFLLEKVLEDMENLDLTAQLRELTEEKASGGAGGSAPKRGTAESLPESQTEGTAVGENCGVVNGRKDVRNAELEAENGKAV